MRFLITSIACFVSFYGFSQDDIPGCILPFACNYNPEASCYLSGSCDFSCLFGLPQEGGLCLDPLACNYGEEEPCEYFDDEGELCVQGGCTTSGASNYDPEAEFNDCTCAFGQENYQITLNNNICSGSMENGASTELEIYTNFSIESILVDWGMGVANNYYPPSFLPIFSIESPLYFEYGSYDIQIYITEYSGSIIALSETLFIGNNPTVGTANPGNTDGLCVPFEMSVPIIGFSDNDPTTIYEIDFGDGSINQVFSHLELLEMSSPHITHTYENSSCGYTTALGSQNAFMFTVSASNGCGYSISAIDPIRVCNCDGNDWCDFDELCNELEECDGVLDECGVCNGPGAIYECGCTNITEGECDCEGNQLDASGVCGGDCTSDFNSNGVCDTNEIFGCTYATATNYYDEATTDDGSCEFEEFTSNDCIGDLDGNSYVGSADLLLFLVAYGGVCE